MALTPEFTQKVSAIEQRLGMEPGSLLSVIRFETGGTFGTDVNNRMGSGATGLIQFIRDGQGARDLDRRPGQDEPEDQLDYVEKYLQPYKGKMGTLKDAYMAVLYPKAIGKPEWYPLFTSGTKAYTQNAGLDRDKKGMVTVADAVARVRGSREAAPPTMVAQAPSQDAAPQAPPREHRRQRSRHRRVRQSRRHRGAIGHQSSLARRAHRGRKAESAQGEAIGPSALFG